jgi:predicted amidohydrolase YtcJ
MSQMRTIAAAALLTAALGCTAPEKPAADASGGVMIIQGGTMYLGADQAPVSGSAILVRDGRIAAIDTFDALQDQAPGARVIDAAGKTVLPGLIDSHAHIDGLAIALDIVDLVDTKSFDEILDRVAARAATAAPGEWILGRGWDQNDWETKEFPTAALVDARFPDNPVWLRRIDGHAALANSAAMKIAGIDASAPDPEGGKIVRDAAGNATGVFIDAAMGLVGNHIPAPSRELRKQRLTKAFAYIASQGLTGVHEAGSDSPVELIELYKELADEGALPVRVYYMLPDDEPLLQSWFASGPLVGYKGRLTVRSVKLYADGALGSRGAALLAPYADDPHNSGLMLISKERIVDVARRAKDAGFQVGTHAIGDRGVRTVVDAYQDAGVTAGDRFRVEHFQVASPDDFQRAASAGIIAAVQPTHATSDMPWAEQRVGAERIKGAYAWRRVLDAGGRLAFGSDFPVEQVNPFFGIHSAVTRQDHDGHPPGGWTPSEKLTLAETLRGFTIDGAFASFEETDLGTIEQGKAADLTIVDGNLPDMPEADLWKASVSMTIVGGEIAFERK